MTTLAIPSPATRPPSAGARRRHAMLAGLVAGGALLVASAPAAATAYISPLAKVCGGTTGSPCVSGNSSLWTPPSGSAVSSSVAHGWSNILSPGYTYSLSADAQSTVAGPNHWSGTVRAGGYMNEGFYGSNGVVASSAAYVQDQLLLPSTPTWSGAGFMTLTFHVTGSASISYSYAGTSTDPRNSAYAQLAFDCYSTPFGACTATGVPFIDTGIYRETFTSSRDYDNLVTFMLPVRSDVGFVFELDSFLSAGMNLYGNGHAGTISGAAAADFSHTFQLVDADLLDSAYVPVPDWSITADSGFDYAHIAAVVEPPPAPGGTVPEPATFALLGLGGLCASVARRRRLATR